MIVVSYEEDLARIESIVEELERDDLELERALALFEEGVERLRNASKALERAEGKVRLLVERSDGGFELADANG
ncbi:MAG TPA: exodeoxyribonuclease VII small subunit [Gemmatimonadaceae bacterium]|nr:exodeoxyribonuclease VII small subunit [Gemmatimonadaceae bacterium]